MIGKSGSSSAVVPANITRVTLPAGFLEPDSDYEWEVSAIEASDNQTLSSESFTTQTVIALELTKDGLLSFKSLPGHHHQIQMCPQLGVNPRWNVIQRMQATQSVTP